MLVAIKGALQRVGDAEPPSLAATRLHRWAASLQSPERSSPPERRARVPLAVGRTSDRRPNRWMAGGPPGPKLLRILVGALAGTTVAITAAGVLALHRHDGPSEPAAVLALVELAQVERVTTQAAPAEAPGRHPGHLVEIGDRRVWLARHLIDGHEVLVATSQDAFPMPSDARPLGDGRDAPWLARRGHLAVACVSRPAHRLLVGPLPAERLAELGRQLGPL